MYGKAQFNKTAFGSTAGDSASLYATIQNEYGTVVPGIRIRVQLSALTMNAVSAMTLGTLWLKVPLPAVQMDALHGVIPNLTARIPLGSVSMNAEGGMVIHMTAFIPIGNISMNAETTVQATLWAKVPIRSTTAKTENTVVPKFGIYVPMVGVTAGSEYGMEGNLYAKIPIRALILNAQYDTSVKALRTNESEEMELVGLNLAPGQRLIIDTDTMEISVDDEVRVDCWVTGGSFFQLKNGTNILSFTDNAASRKLKTTILWADRYL